MSALPNLSTGIKPPFTNQWQTPTSRSFGLNPEFREIALVRDGELKTL
jgi:hypothetical protein